MPWAPRASHKVPAVGSPSQVIETNDYSLGMNTFLGNDAMPFKNGRPNYWRTAQDARITTLGQYETRKGLDFYSANYNTPTGGASITSLISATGAADHNIGLTTWGAQPFTTTGAVRLAQVQILLKNTAGATGTPIVEIWTDNAGVPGTKITRSSANSGLITSTYAAYLMIGFPDSPALSASTKYWIVVYVQLGGSGNYSWRSTTTNTAALTSVDSGATWSTTTFGFNFAAVGADNNPTIGIHQAIKSDGTTKTLYATGTKLEYMDALLSSPVDIKTGLNASATAYRFVTVNDIVYYVNGYDGYRKWDFTTESQVNATNYSLICQHKGLMFLVDVNDPNKLVFSNFGVYETFTSTDFFEIPAPKTGDPITALISLNGYLLIFTRNNKFILSGDDNSTFRLAEAPDQKGTFTQETATQDQNFVYYLSDDGVYRSNGNESQLMSTNNYQDILNLSGKDRCCVAVNRGRFYLWFPSAGSSRNDSCWVWNLNYDNKSQTIESIDTNAYVSRAASGQDLESPLIVGSSVVGTVYWQELPSNDYSNLGGDINFYLQTHYIHFGTPAVLKEVRRWLLRVKAQSGSYAITPMYASDLRPSFQTLGDVPVQGGGYIWGAATTIWGSFTWGTDVEGQTTLVVPGEYRRIAFAYKHYATRQPHSFLGHTFMFETRRMR